MNFKNADGEYIGIQPTRLVRAIDAIHPVAVSVRCADGSECTITDIAIDVRPNGTHILLDCPEACLAES
ncbi:hypothetical protein [Gemmiger sp.]